MIRNYFIIALRTIMRNKAHSLINIAGLSTGITACILIFLYVQDELSFDQHWRDADRILKINQIFTNDGKVDPYACTSRFLAPQLKETFPEIEEIVRIDPHNHQTVSYEGIRFNEDKQYNVDGNFFKVFNFELLKGDPATCLMEPNCVVISEDMARRFFGDADPMGKLLKYPQKLYKVTGVLKKTKYESHLKPTALLSMQSPRRNGTADDWFGLSMFTYVKLRTVTSPENFDKKLKLWTTKVFDPAIKEKKFSFTSDLKSQELSDVYFDHFYAFNQFEQGDRKYIPLFGWVALFILVIACFNYMNLSTARALKRAREVGLRKVVGAERRQLIVQFMGESFVITVIAVLFSLILLAIFTPSFNALTEKTIQPSQIIANGGFWLILLLIILFISLVGGSYPAFYLSAFRPAQVLKGKLIEMQSASFFGRIGLRRLLVIGQFTISTVIIIATIMVFKQLVMMKNKDLGFNIDQVLVMKFPSYMDSASFSRIEPFRNEVLRDPSIVNFATTEQFVGSARIDFFVKEEGKSYSTTLNVNFCDYAYLDVLGIRLLKGRNFSKELSSDMQNVVINESAAKFLKWNDPIGKVIGFDGITYGKVIGVVKDYNYKSPHSPIEPMALVLNQERNATGSIILVKLKAGRIREGVKFIEATWKKFWPENPVSDFFLDDKFNEQYHKDNILLILFTCFSGLTILISCLGLLGLAAYATQQRTREIGVRKVLGATVSQITYLLSKDFMMLVGISFVLASPIAIYFVNSWLSDFAYRTEISLWVFCLSGALAFIIAFASISFHTLKAAIANPVNSLRTE